MAHKPQIWCNDNGLKTHWNVYGVNRKLLSSQLEKRRAPFSSIWDSQRHSVSWLDSRLYVTALLSHLFLQALVPHLISAGPDRQDFTVPSSQHHKMAKQLCVSTVFTHALVQCGIGMNHWQAQSYRWHWRVFKDVRCDEQCCFLRYAWQFNPFNLNQP